MTAEATTGKEAEIGLLQEIADLLRTHHVAKDVMDVGEAAAYLSIGETFLRDLISLYRIPFAPLKGKGGRGRVVLRKTDLDKFLDSQVVLGPQDAMRLNDGRRRLAA